MIGRLLGRKTKTKRKTKPDSSNQEDLNLPHEDRIKKWGHRAYIGGRTPELWYGIGRRQYHFLTSRGLNHSHVFLDVACGALRLGQYLIPMLDKGNYYGLEAEPLLIDAGIKHELLFDVVEKKVPSFASNYDFDVSFCPGYDFAIAQSLFTHLTTGDIEKCFKSLAKIARPDSQFYYTFFEGDASRNKHSVSHANRNWKYPYAVFEEIAHDAGFHSQYIGDWQHERKQIMALATPKRA